MIIMEKDEFDQMLDEAEKQFFQSSEVEKKRLNNPRNNPKLDIIKITVH